VIHFVEKVSSKGVASGFCLSMLARGFFFAHQNVATRMHGLNRGFSDHTNCIGKTDRRKNESF
jgi:hypothetical protein